MVAHKVGEIKDYMEKVAALVHEYVPPDKEKIQAAAAAGHVSMKPDAATGIAALGVQDYLKAGDALDIGLDLKGSALSTYNVRSYVDDPKDDAVTLAVQFDKLPDGTSYPQQTSADVTAKKIQVKDEFGLRQDPIDGRGTKDEGRTSAVADSVSAASADDGRVVAHASDKIDIIMLNTATASRARSSSLRARAADGEDRPDGHGDIHWGDVVSLTSTR